MGIPYHLLAMEVLPAFFLFFDDGCLTEIRYFETFYCKLYGDHHQKVTDSQTEARTGILHTDHGEIHTPIFMPVGTGPVLKACLHWELESIVHAEIMLSNTYHLFLRPGTDVLSARRRYP